MKNRFFIPVCTTFILVFFITDSLFAQLRRILIDPTQTGNGIDVIHGPHVVSYNENIPFKKQLIIMMVGTNGKASGNRKADSVWASMGYRVLTIDYKNTVISTACSNIADSACFNNFRRELVTGDQVSDKVDVSKTNSILNRIDKALRYLSINYPDQGWNKFVHNTGPVWKSIILAGYSQGTGNAAYISKIRKVNKVLLFAGPQDFSNIYKAPASWQSQPSRTPPSRYYALLHAKDNYGVDKQIANCQTLMKMPIVDSLHIQPNVVLTGKKHILITDLPAKNPHGKMMSTVFQNVWRYMLNAR